jgi:uncharacterized protein (DUF4415 family)
MDLEKHDHGEGDERRPRDTPNCTHLGARTSTRISVFIDNAVLDAFRARAGKAGTGCQTMMNEALRRYLSDADQPVTEKALHQIPRQEMPEYLGDLTAPSIRTRARKTFAGTGSSALAFHRFVDVSQSSGHGPVGP